MVDKYERGKDTAQEAIENTAHAVGKIATIITTAVADVTREIGDIITQGFEMREAARRAKRDEVHGGSRSGSDPGRDPDAAAEPAAADVDRAEPDA